MQKSFITKNIIEVQKIHFYKTNLQPYKYGIK